jgi:tRNA/tmRNA/rRNA uracil-C5-methylase (TrmA/RlmC/RlmD family)
VSDRESALIGPLEVGPIAHGGHCVARWQGRVIFVRHTLPGERVLAAVTDDSHHRYWRADAVQILHPAADRVVPPCPIAGPDLCGGCDFQHVSLPGQRRLKAAVVAEQLRRLAGLDWTGEVEPIGGPPTAAGLGWRTRMRYHATSTGLAGLRRHRSHDLVPLPGVGCLIADPRTPRVVGRTFPPGAELVAVVGATGSALLIDGHPADPESDPVLEERVVGRPLRVSATGFWQVHRDAAATLVEAVLDGLRPRPEERAFDLYCGVGLFARFLADRGCRVWGVETSAAAARQARKNLSDAGRRVRVEIGRVERALARLPRRADLVVLDPPRSGAGRAVIAAVAARWPRSVAYVACDPAALARDLAYAADSGYRPVSIRAFDLFPMTAHVECVAILAPTFRTREA